MTQREETFEREIKETLAELEVLLLQKGKEYRRDNNPYHNFETGARLTGKHRTEILEGFLLKHLISVSDLKNDLKEAIYPSRKIINEKYNDILLYFLIEKAMMLEYADR